LLDEPTNHLDIEAIQWLEEWLQQYTGSVLLISHDRDFIDGVAKYIAHFEDHQIHLYKGSYSDFERQRAEKLSQQQSIYEKQQVRRAELQRFIDRFKAQATKAKQAQSRIKALERMQLVSAVREKSAYQFKIPCAEKTGSPLVNWFAVNAGYADKPILQECKFSILPGMRIGLLGANGAGKSTLIKTLAHEQNVLAGEVIESDHLKIGYFAQHQLEALDIHASPILHIQRLSSTASEQSIRDFLGSYRIIGDMALDTIENFSGGEKARLALAIVAWQKPNMLLMDEPTNHLDIEMREALAEALQAFEGAVVLVSHDRYLLRHCVDEFWLVEEGAVKTFTGDLNDYYELKKQQQITQKAPEEKAKDNKKLGRQEAAQKRMQLAPITKGIKKLEEKMDKFQVRLDKARETLATTEIYEADKKNQLQQLLEEESICKTAIEELELEWFELQEQLQLLEAEI
jgi:ATP-binding cassette subfamily F protein 3